MIFAMMIIQFVIYFYVALLLMVKFPLNTLLTVSSYQSTNTIHTDN